MPVLVDWAPYLVSPDGTLSFVHYIWRRVYFVTFIVTGLRHSGSKPSALGTSRESIQSESAASRTIITTPVFEDELIQPAASSSQEEDAVPFDLTLEEVSVQPKYPDLNRIEQFDTSSKPSLDVFELDENGKASLGDVSGSFPEDWLAVQDETVDFSAPPKISENKPADVADRVLLPSGNSQAEMNSVSLVDEPITVTSGPLLSPAPVRSSSSVGGSVTQVVAPVCDHRVFEEKLAKITAEVSHKLE